VSVCRWGTWRRCYATSCSHVPEPSHRFHRHWPAKQTSPPWLQRRLVGRTKVSARRPVGASGGDVCRIEARRVL